MTNSELRGSCTLSYMSGYARSYIGHMSADLLEIPCTLLSQGIATVTTQIQLATLSMTCASRHVHALGKVAST